nr:hydroxymethylbilane synthase [uncultured Ruminococcus sp.]
MKVRIGTRKSKLALAQTEMFANALKKRFDDIDTEIVCISTKGDKILDKPLAMIGGKGVFISELENALLSGVADMAVHSAKDLPLELADGLEISSALQRGNYRDVLVARKNNPIQNREDFIVGTGSLRRQSFIKKIYPLVCIKDIRGNVDTRLGKLMNGDYDAIILAAAGLERLSLYNSEKYNVTPFEYSDFLPAPCQAIVVAESKTGSAISERLKEISHTETMLEFETERQIPKLLNADCGMPVGAFSKVTNGKIKLIISTDCKKTISGSADIKDRFNLAKRLVSEL